MIVDDLIEHCPFCGSNDLMVGNHQKSPGTWLGLVVCNGCGITVLAKETGASPEDHVIGNVRILPSSENSDLPEA